MSIWRVQLRPDSDNIALVDVCIRQEVVGIGWRVPTRPADRDEYWSLGEKEYGAHRSEGSCPNAPANKEE
jgi:hypothetical protein